MATKTKTQTKTKTATRKQSKTGNGGVKLPSGYTVIGRAPNWDFDKHAVLEGVRGETHEVVMDEGTKNERKSRNCIVTNDEGAFTLWESGTLRDFFDQTEDGDQIRVEFLGLGTAKKKGQNAPKLFSTAVKR